MYTPSPPSTPKPIPIPSDLFPIPPEFVPVQNATWSEPRSSGPSSPGIGSASSRSRTSTLKFVRTTSFRLPLDSERLFVVSRGGGSEDARPLLEGNIQLTQADTSSRVLGLGFEFNDDDMVFDEKRDGCNVMSREEEEEDVRIEIAVEYPDSGSIWFDWLRVCSLRRKGKEGQNGIGIFTPTQKNSNFSGYRVEIIVTFPQPRASRSITRRQSSSFPSSSISSSLSIVKINNFETDMKSFSHQIDNLSTTILFRSISIRTDNKPIFVESLRARKANFQTTNAPIEGTFCVSSFLNMKTTNARMRTSVLLENTDSRKFSQLIMANSNGPISSSIILSSPNQSRGGNFSILSKTHNAPINLTFPSAPSHHNLQLRVSTMLAKAEVQLPETYEGRFDVQSRRGSVDVALVDRGSSSHHSGLGSGITSVTPCASTSGDLGRSRGKHKRRRILEFERREETRISGWVNVSGEDEGKFRGEVEIVTSMVEASLHI